MNRPTLPIISLFEPHETDWLLPEYKTPGAAAIDLRARIDSEIHLPIGTVCKIPCGLKIDMTESPGLCAEIIPRSGLGSAGLTLINCVSLIDNDYQGEIMIALVNMTDHEVKIERGDRLAQMKFSPFIQVNWQPVESFKSSSERGENGHGSTGTR